MDLGTQIINYGRVQLDLNPPEDLELEARVAYCWRNWQPKGDILIVLDDVTDYQTIKPYLPSNEVRFKVIVTTRLQKIAQAFQQLNLPVLSEDEALELLALLAGGERIFCELETRKDTPSELCKWLGYLPLGLELVGQYLAEREDLSLAKMQQRLENKRLEQRALQKPTTETTAHRGVQAAFELSWQELDEEAQELACLLSLFALTPIPWSLVEQCLIPLPSPLKRGKPMDEEDLEDIRDGVLVKGSLLQRIGEGTYQLHQLLREFLHDKLELSAEADHLKQNYCQVMVAVAKEIPDKPTRELIVSKTFAMPHLERVATDLTNFLSDENLIQPFIGLGRFYKGQGFFLSAKPWYKQCLSVTRARLGADHPAVATSLNELATLYHFGGCYSEAESLYLQALELSKRLWGDEHPTVAGILNNLAHTYCTQGRYGKAEPLYLQVLELNRRFQGADNLDIAPTLNNLALLYNSQGRYSKAESFYKQALELSRSSLGEEHPNVATSFSNLATFYHQQGRFDEAKLLYKKALELRQRLLTDNHPDIATNLNNLANLYREQGQYDKAEPLLLKALEIHQALGGNHPDISTILISLGLLYTSQGRYDEAEPRLLKALEIDQNLWDNQHPKVATSLSNLANLYLTQKRYSDAEPLYVKELELRKRLLGENHPSVATSLNNLGALFYRQGRYRKAEPLYRQALELYKCPLGQEHPDVAKSLNNLAELYRSQGRYKEAEPLYIQALELCIKLLGEDHHNTRVVRDNLERLREQMEKS